MPQEPYNKCDEHNKAEIKKTVKNCRCKYMRQSVHTLAGIMLEKSLHIKKWARPAATKIAPNIIPVLTPIISGHTVCIA